MARRRTDWGRAVPLEIAAGEVAIAGVGEADHSKASGRSSTELSEATVRYVATLAESLMPVRGQLLVLEGHAPVGDRLLAWRRADALRAHLITTHGFEPTRVEARAWMTELKNSAQDTVDARLITPAIASAN